MTHSGHTTKERHDGERLKNRIREDKATGQFVDERSSQQTWVDEGKSQLTKVIEICSSEMCARLANPVEVLERIYNKKAIATGHVSALNQGSKQEAGEDRKREPSQSYKNSYLEGIALTP
jgi:hypothetical protein